MRKIQSTENPERDDWMPTATIGNLKLRASLLTRIREFFAERGVLEVETPVVSSAASLDPNLDSIQVSCQGPGILSQGAPLYLQTSPEFAMKRLLAAGSGPIFQICKAFRNGEVGRLHNPEFTMLEWYRPGFDHHALMDEVESLIVNLFTRHAGCQRISYRELFERHLGIDPFIASTRDLQEAARRFGVGDVAGLNDDDRDGWLDLLISHEIEPKLGRSQPLFVYDYPASQAALARIRGESPPVAERFELYMGGVELANGYHELIDANEQGQRFVQEQARRRARQLPDVHPDQRLLKALAHGLPPCAGVALGVDRLVMIAASAEAINDVLAFPIERA